MFIPDAFCLFIAIPEDQDASPVKTCNGLSERVSFVGDGERCVIMLENVANEDHGNWTCRLEVTDHQESSSGSAFSSVVNCRRSKYVVDL